MELNNIAMLLIRTRWCRRGQLAETGRSSIGLAACLYAILPGAAVETKTLGTASQPKSGMGVEPRQVFHARLPMARVNTVTAVYIPLRHG